MRYSVALYAGQCKNTRSLAGCNAMSDECASERACVQWQLATLSIHPEPLRIYLYDAGGDDGAPTILTFTAHERVERTAAKRVPRILF